MRVRVWVCVCVSAPRSSAATPSGLLPGDPGRPSSSVKCACTQCVCFSCTFCESLRLSVLPHSPDRPCTVGLRSSPHRSVCLCPAVRCVSVCVFLRERVSVFVYVFAWFPGIAPQRQPIARAHTCLSAVTRTASFNFVWRTVQHASVLACARV